MNPIELYTWKTSNGKKATIMLEECGLPYNLHPIDISTDIQFAEDFVKINPNSKIPAMIDPDGPGDKPFTLFESGAMLMYLAEKTGKFMPQEMAARYEVIQWVMFQMGGIGPIFGQVHHFKRAAKEQRRLLRSCLEGRGSGARQLATVLLVRGAHEDRHLRVESLEGTHGAGRHTLVV